MVAPPDSGNIINNEIFLEASSTDSLNDYVLYQENVRASNLNNIKKKSKHSSSEMTSGYNDYACLEEEEIDIDKPPFVKSENDDLVNMTNLNEQIVLDQLKKRFTKNQIYVS